MAPRVRLARSVPWFRPDTVPVAAHKITTDTSPSSSMAQCHAERGGCGERSQAYTSREEALAWVERHRVFCIGPVVDVRPATVGASA